jgi:DNA repair protein RadD
MPAFLAKPPVKFELRWYQEEARDAIWHYFADGNTGNPLVALPTGTGKSVVIGDFVRCMVQYYPGTRIVKLTHVKELIRQNFDKLLALWPLAPAGIYSAGIGRRDVGRQITFAGIASVAKKAKLFGHIDFVVIDECHLLGPKDSTSYQRFIAELKERNPELHVIGFTATPYRNGQGHLTDGKGLFTDVCYDLTNPAGFKRLIEEGHLCPLVPKRPSRELDVSNVSTSQGDYNQLELQAAVDREEITRAAIEEMMHYGEDREHWLVFAAGVEHSRHIADELNARGISAISIDSKMTVESLPEAAQKDMRRDETARDTAVRWWKDGLFRCAVNNNILTTGIDFPGLDLIGFLRPTKSPSLWVQGLGRGTRPFPGKNNCLVLDFAGNTQRLGTIDDPLLPRPKGAKRAGSAPVKLCPSCSCWNHSSVRFCAACGEEFVAVVKIKDTASTLELMSSEEPKLIDFEVTKVEYDLHAPRDGRPPSLKVSYFCKDTPLRFKEWLAFESIKGMARRKAATWWNARAMTEVPKTSEEALHRAGELEEARVIRVWVNTKYPEITAHDFTGAGFEPKE